ncbi:hypothetical protein, partial [Actinomyces sp.]|uniref:hypothetical protein n=1 Tax=Actinomyces sp. TaxID=29317 RepID=UPI002914C696
SQPSDPNQKTKTKQNKKGQNKKHTIEFTNNTHTHSSQQNLVGKEVRCNAVSEFSLPETASLAYQVAITCQDS